MQTVTLHREPNGDPVSARIVEDGFRLSVFLLPPAALLARGLLGACLLWLALVAVIVGAALAGVLSPAAALLAIVVVNAVLAIDAADLERRRLRKLGWSSQILAGVPGAATSPVPQAGAPQAASSFVPGPSATPDIIGLFPDRPR